MKGQMNLKPGSYEWLVIRDNETLTKVEVEFEENDMFFLNTEVEMLLDCIQEELEENELKLLSAEERNALKEQMIDIFGYIIAA
jgi:hypothetical protein